MFSKNRSGLAIMLVILGMSLLMFILPVSPWFLDFAIVLNFLGATTLLVFTLSVDEPLHISTYPTWLLLMTLFRLGLNIASTRLILTTGSAGDIIQTFAYISTNGQLVAGFILFLIVTLVQFIVVAKGSERVAEVLARFSLDALPGKQMSIDADLRAGLLSQVQAAEKRNHLEQTSQFYGAMDGAMKFIKGDTIAGLIIAVINLFGGFMIGVLVRKMSLIESLNTYALLTIGEGLVAQIPAIMLAIAAGFMITWVQNPENKQAIGSILGKQILHQPKALLVVAGLLFLLGMIPGFPFAQFLIVSFVLGIVAMSLLWSRHHSQSAPQPIHTFLTTTILPVNPLVLEVSENLYQQFSSEPSWLICFNKLYPNLKHRLSRHYGVPFPELSLTVQPALPDNHYLIRLFDIPIAKTALSTDLISFEEELLRRIAFILSHHAHEFMGLQELRAALNQIALSDPELVHEVIPRMMSLHKFHEIIYRLLEEGIPVRDLKAILQIMTTLQTDHRETPILLEETRAKLKRLITHLFCGADKTLQAFTMAPELEAEIRLSLREIDGETHLLLAPDLMDRIQSALRSQLQRCQQAAPILTEAKLRRPLRLIIRDEFPQIPVLSFQELASDVRVEILETIRIIDSPSVTQSVSLGHNYLMAPLNQSATFAPFP